MLITYFLYIQTLCSSLALFVELSSILLVKYSLTITKFHLFCEDFKLISLYTKKKEKSLKTLP